MTKAELIKALEGVPDDAVVMVPDLEQGLGLIEASEIVHDVAENEVHIL